MAPNPDQRGNIGVVVGKFNPPHLGHLHLVEFAAARVGELYVILGDRADQSIAAADRAAWLTDAAPANVNVLITPDDLPAENEPWAERALEILPAAPEVTFTSEPWGEGWAAAMGAQHVLVDQERGTVPISATRIRSDVGTHFQWLVPAARAALARRVVVAGAESTGKSTLAEDLARTLSTAWAPEHGRWYWEGRRYLGDAGWTADEFRRIARAQQSLMDDLACKANGGVLISDTDALVTAVWRERYVGSPDPALEAMSAAHRPDLYLVCAPDFDWVQDGTRESHKHRQWMHEATLDKVRASGVPMEIVSGARSERLRRALELIQPLTVFDPLT